MSPPMIETKAEADKAMRDLAATMKKLDKMIAAKEVMEARRNLVGGLIRYIKDGENDLGRLLFNYVHIDDYAQAMIEGWGDLHSLIHTQHERYGPAGLPLTLYPLMEQVFMSFAIVDTVEGDVTEATERVRDAVDRYRAWKDEGSIAGISGALDTLYRNWATSIGLALPEPDRDEEDGEDPVEVWGDWTTKEDDEP